LYPTGSSSPRPAPAVCSSVSSAVPTM
jgi:hypothetical protein